jgi:mRNA interferase MazF
MMESRFMIKHAVVLVPFPFDDLSSSKVRPALCLTSEIGNFRHIVIAFISSKTPAELLPSDYLIKKGTSDWQGSGLAADSVVRLHKLVTIPRALIKRKLGKIPEPAAAKVRKKLFELFD